MTDWIAFNIYAGYAVSVLVGIWLLGKYEEMKLRRNGK